MPRIQELQQYTTLNGAELIPCLQYGQTEDGFILSRDLINLVENAVPNASTGYVFAAGDEKRIVEFIATTSVIAGIPADATTNFAIGSVLRAVQIGTGRVFFGTAGGVTVRWPKDNNNVDCKVMRAVNSTVSFRKRDVNDWHVVGDLSVS